MRNRLLSTLLFAAALAACDHDPAGPVRDATGDVTPHREGVVQANGTTLHYLDWGGSGPPLVLIAGLGDNAHVFDDLAEKLSSRYRVVALTRRGYGQSGRPTSGYDVNTLVDDDVAVIDALHLGRVYLAAHSIGAQEMTRLAVRYPERVARLVYIEGSLNDRSQSDECRALPHATTSRAAASATPAFDPPEPTADDVASFAAFMRYQRRLLPEPWTRAIENSWRHAVVLDGEGRVTAISTDPSIEAQVRAGACRYVQEFSRLRSPALAIGAVPGVIQDLWAWVPRDLSAEEATQAQEIVALYQAAIPSFLADFAAQAPGGSTMLVRSSNHYVFLRDEAQVIAALRAFLPSHLDR